MKTWFKGETDQGVAEGREPWSQRRATERGTHKGTHKLNISPKPLAQKTRDWICEFLQPGLKPRVLKINGLGWDGALRALHYSWGEGRQMTWGKTAWISNLKNARGWQGRNYSLRMHPWEAAFTETSLSLGIKELASAISLPHLSAETLATCLCQAPPTTLWQDCPSQSGLPQSKHSRTLPQKTSTDSYPHHISRPESPVGPQFWWS